MPESAMQNTPEHHRRKRYSGKYPRRFEEKYKEHQPEKYQNDIEKIISKGKTPAGMHIPIMVNEILDFLNIQPGQIGMDATLGYGGHSEKMLECLQGKGHLYATDVDPIESVKTEARLREKGYGPDLFTVRHMNFRNVDQVAEPKFDFILADLGVSSMQIDNPARGFSYKTDGPLDLRLNPEEGESAAERLASLSEEETAGMLAENSDEPLAEELASAIASAKRKGALPKTTGEMRALVTQVIARYGSRDAAERKEEVKKTCARVFQALRIDVNQEFEALYEFLEKLPAAMNPGGRIAILTFHSGEDRLVKKAFREGLRSGAYAEISEDVTRPTPEECRRNPRARSTKLRFAVVPPGENKE